MSIVSEEVSEEKIRKWLDRDPYWRSKIIPALEKVRPKGRIGKKIRDKWLRLARQTPLFRQ